LVYDGIGVESESTDFIIKRLPHYPTLQKSKYGPEADHFSTDFDDFGVVEKLRSRAFQ